MLCYTDLSEFYAQLYCNLCVWCFCLRRYDAVVVELHRGTQCSSCGLRFKEANNENYRKHLDWHFRVNRKEKETVAAHRSWFITMDVCRKYQFDLMNRDSNKNEIHFRFQIPNSLWNPFHFVTKLVKHAWFWSRKYIESLEKFPKEKKGWHPTSN